MKLKRTIAVVVIVLLISAVAYSGELTEEVIKLREKALKVTVEEMFNLASARSDLVILDTRGPKAYAAGHIPTAINIPGWEIPQHENLLPSKDTPIVTYCDGQTCSMGFYAADKLAQRKFATVAVYAGGVREWKQIGLPFVTTMEEQRPSISAADLDLLIDGAAPIKIYYAGTQQFFLLGAIPGSVSLHYSTVDQNLDKLPKDKSDSVVVYGRNRIDPTPYALASKLIELGYTNVKIFKGGLAEWQKGN